MSLLKNKKIIITLSVVLLCMVTILILDPKKKQKVIAKPIEKKESKTEIVEKKVEKPKKQTSVSTGSLGFKTVTHVEEKKRIYAVDNLENITLLKRRSTDNIKNTPDGSLAIKIADNKLVRWQPKWRYSDIGGVILPSTDLSSDQSVLAIVELFGGENQFYGSNVIFINTYNWKVLTIKKFTDKKISKILFIPNTNNIVMVTDKQTLMEENESNLISYDINTGAMQNIEMEKKIHDIAVTADGEKVFVTTENKKLYTIQSYDFSFQRKDIYSDKMKLATSEKNVDLLVLGDNDLNLFNSLSGINILKYQLPKYTIAKSMTFINTQKLSLILSTKNGEALYYKENKLNKTLSKWGTGKVTNAKIVVSEKKKAKPQDVILVEENINNKISIYSDDLVKIGEVTPAKVKPRLKHGPALFIRNLKHSKRILILDKLGNLYLLYKNRKRWMKKVVFSVIGEK